MTGILRQAALVPRKADHRFCLIPHRYEIVNQRQIHQLLVDGPIDPEYLGQFMQHQRTGRGIYEGQEAVSFDLANNPIPDVL